MTAWIIALALLAAQSSQASILTVQAGKYSSVTVQISEDVPRDLCQTTLNNLENLLTSTSRQLFGVTKGRGYFESVQIMLPSSWTGSDCINGRNVTDSWARVERPDFKLAKDGHPIFGQQPLASQYGGCGVSGREIRLPFGLVSSHNVTRNTELLTFREWVRYRYGTFSEVGFEGDPLYPLRYKVGSDDDRLNAGCGNLTKPEKMMMAKGEIGPHQHQQQMVEQTIKAICDSSSDYYDRDSPTKQNILCHRLSSLEVLLNHPDFGSRSKRDNLTDKTFAIEEEEDNENNIFVSPSFGYVLPSRMRYILVLDVSQSMALEDTRQWEMTRNALFRFMGHLPAGSEVGIVTFGASARINIEPTLVTAANREGLYGRVPFRLLNDPVGCLECGLKLAEQMLVSNAANGAAIVLVSGTETIQTSNSLDSLKQVVFKKSLPVFNIAFGQHLHPDLASLARFGGNYAVLTGGGDKRSLVQTLADIFVAILNRNNKNEKKIFKSYEKHFALDNHILSKQRLHKGMSLSGNFVVEDNLRSDLWMVLTCPFKEDVELFEVTSPSGKRKVFPKFEHGIVYFHLPGLSETGIWSYKASLYQQALPSSLANAVSMEVFASANQHQTIQVDAWTSIPPGGQSALDEPVIIYASVTKGPDVPVLNAQVTATVFRPGSSVAQTVVLKDQGTGYPDITNGDGVYSGYFTGFSTEAGLYSVNVEASHNSGRASVPKSINIPAIPCCGSQVSQAFLYTVPTSPFTRFMAATSMNILAGVEFQVRNGQPEMHDVFGPSRVTDLKVMSYVNGTLYATLQWTAPGGDYNAGQAATYEIRCYTNAEALSDPNFASMGIPVHSSLLPEPGFGGTQQTATVGLPWANEVFYYGLVSIDQEGNRSPVSNLVPVFAAEPSTLPKMDNSLDSVGRNSQHSLTDAFSSAVMEAFGNNDVLIYVIAGVVSGLVLIVVLIVVLSVCRTKRRKAAEKKKQAARTQIFVNDLETAGPLSDLSPEKQQYTSGPEIWTTSAAVSAVSAVAGHNHSPTGSVEDYAMMYSQGQANWSYLAGQAGAVQYSGPDSRSLNNNTTSSVPVHEYRTAFNSTSEELGGTPTYQNWNCKPPSDNGTATTSSTECYDDNSDHHSEKHKTITVQPLRRFSEDHTLNQDPATISLSPSFCSELREKRRRQESLV